MLQDNTSRADVAPWSYKWVDGRDGIGWWTGQGRGKYKLEHLSVLIMQKVAMGGWKADCRDHEVSEWVSMGAMQLHNCDMCFLQMCKCEYCANCVCVFCTKLWQEWSQRAICPFSPGPKLWMVETGSYKTKRLKNTKCWHYVGGWGQW